MCVIMPFFLFFPFIIFLPGLSFSFSPWGYAWHWGKIHTRRKWSLLTARPSRGWARGLWRSLGRPLLWLFEPCSPPGLRSSAPSHHTHTGDKMRKIRCWKQILNMCEGRWAEQSSLPVQSELWPSQSLPPAVSSWKGRRGTWLSCWSSQLRCHRPGSSGLLQEWTQRAQVHQTDNTACALMGSAAAVSSTDLLTCQRWAVDPASSWRHCRRRTATQRKEKQPWVLETGHGRRSALPLSGTWWTRHVSGSCTPEGTGEAGITTLSPLIPCSK